MDIFFGTYSQERIILCSICFQLIRSHILTLVTLLACSLFCYSFVLFVFVTGLYSFRSAVIKLGQEFIPRIANPEISDVFSVERLVLSPDLSASETGSCASC